MERCSHCEGSKREICDNIHRIASHYAFMIVMLQERLGPTIDVTDYKATIVGSAAMSLIEAGCELPAEDIYGQIEAEIPKR